MGKQGVVNIHGKNYKTVVLRVNEFREACKASDGWGIETALLYHDDNRVVVYAIITSPDDKVVGSGLAEEFRNSSTINKTSALEVAETSAIGRALASIGLGGEEYASADEVLNAIQQQNATSPAKKETKPSGGDKQNSDASKREQAMQELYAKGILAMGTEEFTKRRMDIQEHGYDGVEWWDMPVDQARAFYNDINDMINNY